MAARIVVAEDDPKQAQLLRLYLEREGHIVVVARDGREALEQARRRAPDLMILDIMMPEVDGLDVLRILGAEMELPIILVTGRSTEDDLLLGLDLGADDYLTKPYSPRELVARVRSVLRRTGGVGEQASELAQGRLRVDLNRHKVYVDGAEVDCTPREFDILATLLAEPGKVFSRQQLLEAVFGWDYDGLERTIDVHVLNLRKKVEVDPAAPRLLLTVFGVGYKMTEEVA